MVSLNREISKPGSSTKGSIRKRAAFTMIELIFAIVIIAFVMFSISSVIARDALSQEDSLVQESIQITVTKLSQIFTYPWAPNSSPGGNLFTTSEVLEAPNGDPELDRNISDFRVGHFQFPMRRRMTPSSNQRIAPVIQSGAVAVPANLDDFNNPNPVAAVQNGADTSATAYKKQYQLINRVVYVNDNTDYTANNVVFNYDTNAFAGITNIKMVQVTTRELENDGVTWTPIVQLTSFSSNIGETEFYRRRYE